eukprot:jgi/Mesvir1/13602/Mv06782-RA.1
MVLVAPVIQGPAAGVVLGVVECSLTRHATSESPVIVSMQTLLPVGCAKRDPRSCTVGRAFSGCFVITAETVGFAGRVSGARIDTVGSRDTGTSTTARSESTVAQLSRAQRRRKCYVRTESRFGAEVDLLATACIETPGDPNAKAKPRRAQQDSGNDSQSQGSPYDASVAFSHLERNWALEPSLPESAAFNQPELVSHAGAGGGPGGAGGGGLAQGPVDTETVLTLTPGTVLTAARRNRGVRKSSEITVSERAVIKGAAHPTASIDSDEVLSPHAGTFGHNFFARRRRLSQTVAGGGSRFPRSVYDLCDPDATVGSMAPPHGTSRLGGVRASPAADAHAGTPSLGTSPSPMGEIGGGESPTGYYSRGGGGGAAGDAYVASSGAHSSRRSASSAGYAGGPSAEGGASSVRRDPVSSGVNSGEVRRGSMDSQHGLDSTGAGMGPPRRDYSSDPTVASQGNPFSGASGPGPSQGPLGRRDSMPVTSDAKGSKGLSEEEQKHRGGSGAGPAGVAVASKATGPNGEIMWMTNTEYSDVPTLRSSMRMSMEGKHRSTTVTNDLFEIRIHTPESRVPKDKGMDAALREQQRKLLETLTAGQAGTGEAGREYIGGGIRRQDSGSDIVQGPATVIGAAGLFQHASPAYGLVRSRSKDALSPTAPGPINTGPTNTGPPSNTGHPSMHRSRSKEAVGGLPSTGLSATRTRSKEALSGGVRASPNDASPGVLSLARSRSREAVQGGELSPSGVDMARPMEEASSPPAAPAGGAGAAGSLFGRGNEMVGSFGRTFVGLGSVNTGMNVYHKANISMGANAYSASNVNYASANQNAASNNNGGNNGAASNVVDGNKDSDMGTSPPTRMSISPTWNSVRVGGAISPRGTLQRSNNSNVNGSSNNNQYVVAPHFNEQARNAANYHPAQNKNYGAQSHHAAAAASGHPVAGSMAPPQSRPHESSPNPGGQHNPAMACGAAPAGIRNSHPGHEHGVRAVGSRERPVGSLTTAASDANMRGVPVALGGSWVGSGAGAENVRVGGEEGRGVDGRQRKAPIASVSALAVPPPSPQASPGLQSPVSPSHSLSLSPGWATQPAQPGGQPPGGPSTVAPASSGGSHDQGRERSVGDHGQGAVVGARNMASFNGEDDMEKQEEGGNGDARGRGNNNDGGNNNRDACNNANPNGSHNDANDRNASNGAMAAGTGVANGKAPQAGVVNGPGTGYVGGGFVASGSLRSPRTVLRRVERRRSMPSMPSLLGSFSMSTASGMVPGGAVASTPLPPVLLSGSSVMLPAATGGGSSVMRDDDNGRGGGNGEVSMGGAAPMGVSTAGWAVPGVRLTRYSLDSARPLLRNSGGGFPFPWAPLQAPRVDDGANHNTANANQGGGYGPIGAGYGMAGLPTNVGLNAGFGHPVGFGAGGGGGNGRYGNMLAGVGGNMPADAAASSGGFGSSTVTGLVPPSQQGERSLSHGNSGGTGGVEICLSCPSSSGPFAPLGPSPPDTPAIPVGSLSRTSGGVVQPASGTVPVPPMVPGVVYPVAMPMQGVVQGASGGSNNVGDARSADNTSNKDNKNDHHCSTSASGDRVLYGTIYDPSGAEVHVPAFAMTKEQVTELHLHLQIHRYLSMGCPVPDLLLSLLVGKKKRRADNAAGGNAPGGGSAGAADGSNGEVAEGDEEAARGGRRAGDRSGGSSLDRDKCQQLVENMSSSDHRDKRMAMSVDCSTVSMTQV